LRKLQALVRQRQKRFRFLKAKTLTIILQSYARKFVLRRKFKRLMKELFEQKERQRLRILEEKQRQNADLAHRRSSVLTAAKTGDVRNMSEILQTHPEDYFTFRDEQNNNATVLQLAILSGNMLMLYLLNPTKEDLLTKDELGNTAVHYAILSQHKNTLLMIKYFALVNANETEQLLLTLEEVKKNGLKPRPIVANPLLNMSGLGSALPNPPTVAKKSSLSLFGGFTSSLTGGRSSLSSTTAAPVETPAPVGAKQEEENADIMDQDIANKQQVVELKSGWMSKRGESQIWRKRWVVLTTEALMYFRNNKDKVPRDTLSFARRNEIKIERAPNKPTGIDIYINNQSVKKKRDRVSLMAESEQEMQAWLNLLKAAAGVEVKPLRSSTSTTTITTAATNNNAAAAADVAGKKGGGEIKPLLITKPTANSLLMKVTNNNRETPLHLLCSLSSPTYEADALSTDDILQLATWMVTNLSPMNAFNSKGLTPLQAAIQNGNERFATLLTKFGADPTKTVYGANNTQTSYQLVASSASATSFHELLKQASKIFEQREMSFLPMPPRLRGFHYLSVIFYRQTAMTEFDASIANECALKVATFNANHLPAEPFQISPPPTISSTDAHTWQWYEQFHLQIPLDNLEDHAYAVVELVRKVLSTAKAGAVEDTAAPSANVIAWTKITLDRDIINSETKTLTFYMPPMVDESIGTATAGAGAGQSQPTVHSTMEVELMISRR